MGDDIYKELTENLDFRFGQTAVNKGFVTSEQLKNALNEQKANDVPSNRLKPLRVIGEIFFEKGLMTQKQIQIVLNQISKSKQQDFTVGRVNNGSAFFIDFNVQSTTFKLLRIIHNMDVICRFSTSHKF